MKANWKGVAGLGGIFLTAAHAQQSEMPSVLTPRMAPSTQRLQPLQPAPRRTAAGEIVARVFLFEGNTLISARELHAALTPYLNTKLNAAALNAAVDLVTFLYRKNGYPLAMAYLPEQQVVNGVVRIAVDEGKLGKVRVLPTGDARTVVEAEQARKILAAYVKPEAPVTAADLERPLLLLGDLVGGTVRPVVMRGAAPGSSDVALEVVADPHKAPVTGLITADRRGDEVNGRNRLILKMDFNGLGLAGDKLSVQAGLSTPGATKTGEVAYSIPVGSVGVRVGAMVGKLSYSLGGEFAALEPGGTASVAHAYASYPLIRSNNVDLVGRVGVERRQSNVGSGSVSAVALQMMGDVRESRATTHFSASLLAGRVAISDPGLRATDPSATGFHTGGPFQKINYDFQRLQQLGTSTSLLIKASGQTASKNLAPTEKFSLGGPDRVRAYPQGAGSGDAGVVATAELRTQVPGVTFGENGWLASVFYDVGKIRRNRFPDLAAPVDRTPGNGMLLGGIGLGMRVGQEDKFILRGDLTRSTGDKGSTTFKDRVRLWIQTSLWF